jgi:peptidylprolyl isomerase
MLTLLLPLLAQAAAAQSAGRAQPDAKAPAEIVAAAPAGDWRAIAAEELLVMELAPGPNGRERRVAIQLMPPPFAQGWVANIRLLAKARWWDGTSVNRVQDNYVAQWGDATEKKPLPAGLGKVAEAAYEQDWRNLVRDSRNLPTYDPAGGRSFDNGNCSMTSSEPSSSPCEQWDRPGDTYADGTILYRGWPLASQTKPASEGRRTWPVHCYATVGVGRNLSPDTGTGAELYTVIGHAPRHLDRNIAVVGRVVEGIEHLSSLPRGTEALGFYETAAERTPIRSIRLASDLPAAERPRFQYLSTESASFAAYADARANRRDAFFIRPAGGADICNVPVPVRRTP